jgi:hypothetical protein
MIILGNEGYYVLMPFAILIAQSPKSTPPDPQFGLSQPEEAILSFKGLDLRRARS